MELSYTLTVTNMATAPGFKVVYADVNAFKICTSWNHAQELVSVLHNY